MINKVKAASVALALLGAGTVSADAQDWSGFYGGLGLGTGDGLNINAFATSDISGAIRGGFVGYNLQRGNVVYGAELAVSSADIEIETCSYCVYNRFTDLKARVGWASGRALYFGVLGYSQDTYEVTAVGSSDGSGVVFGVGMDMMVSDRVFIGGEILRRNLGHDPQAPFIAFDAEITTVSARLGMKF